MTGLQEKSCPNSPCPVAALGSPGLSKWKCLSHHQIKALSSKGGSGQCRELPVSELAEARPLEKWAPCSCSLPDYSITY